MDFGERLLQGKGWIVTDMATQQSISIRDGGPLAFVPDENRVLVSSRIHRLDHKAAPQEITNAESFHRLWFLSGSNLVIAKQIRNGVPAGFVLFDWRTGAVSEIPDGSSFAISPDERRLAALHPIKLDGVFIDTCAKARRNLTAEEWRRYAPDATPQNICP